MEPQLKKIGSSAGQSFEIMEVNDPHFYSSWHFHPQCEIMYVQESTGTRIVGDSIQQFKPGDIVLLGPGLPHIWRNEDIYYKKKTKRHVLLLYTFLKIFWEKNQTIYLKCMKYRTC
jgi:hypothetical protein